MTVEPGQPYHFRLLTDALLGYAWPKWVRGGEQFGVPRSFPRGIQAGALAVRLQEGTDPQARLVRRARPGGDGAARARTATRRKPASAGTSTVMAIRSICTYAPAPERSGLYYFHARTQTGQFFAFPWIVAPARPQAPMAVLASNITWNAYNNFGGRSNYIHPDRLPPLPPSTPGWS